VTKLANRCAQVRQESSRQRPVPESPS
jgi:hypothetical protein